MTEIDCNLIESLQEEISSLKEKIDEQERIFSGKRAQLKELYVRKEEEFSVLNEKYNSLLDCMEKLRKEMLDAEEAATLAELMRQEELDVLKRKHCEEMASANLIMKENIDSLSCKNHELEAQLRKMEMDRNANSLTKLDERSGDILPISNNENVLVKMAQRLKINTQEIFKTLNDNSDDSETLKTNDASPIASSEAYKEDIKQLKDKIREAYEKIDALEDTELREKSMEIKNLQCQIDNFRDQLRNETINSHRLGQTLDKLVTFRQAVNRVITPQQRNQLSYILNHETNESTDDMLSMDFNLLRKSFSGNDVTGMQSVDAAFDSVTLGNNETTPQIQCKTRSVTENEWSRMQLELKTLRSKSISVCEMCKNYEDQLQSLQDKFMRKEAEVSCLVNANNDHLRQIDGLQEAKNQAICALNDTAARQEKSISMLSEKVNSLNDSCEKIRIAYEKFRDATDQNLKNLSADRRNTEKKLDRVEKAYNELLLRRAKKAVEMEAEKIELPNDMESAQFYLLSLKEQLIRQKAAYEHVFDKLKSNEMFSKEREISEKMERDGLLNEMNLEKKELQMKIDRLEKDVSTLRVASKSSDTLEETITVLKVELEAVKKNFSNIESENRSLKARLQSLQQELENSESVQKDFVKLSQTLQIQLEQLRQEDKELRWQFDEDVIRCNDCRHDFDSVNEKKKSHCRHCGKIFCRTCLCEIKVGINNRKAHVCKVCHTLLVKDAVPYFSINHA